MSPRCCMCGMQDGRFCSLCGHHLCNDCRTHWWERGQEAFKAALGIKSALHCDHEEGKSAEGA